MRLCPSVGRSVGRMDGPCETCFFQTLKMSCYLYENHWGSPTLTLLNVLGVINVLYVLNVLNVLHVLHGRIVGLLGLVSIEQKGNLELGRDDKRSFQ